MNPHLAAAAVGGVLGLALVTARMIYWPYRASLRRLHT